jgi:hypothetical protein
MVFMQPQRVVVPLFQRPYVWNEENQWEPLWNDVVRVAERVLKRSLEKHQPHFLGAVVNILDLISAERLLPATMLYPRQKKYAHRVATILPDGRIEVDGQAYRTRSRLRPTSADAVRTAGISSRRTRSTMMREILMAWKMMS